MVQARDARTWPAQGKRLSDRHITRTGQRPTSGRSDRGQYQVVASPILPIPNAGRHFTHPIAVLRQLNMKDMSPFVDMNTQFNYVEGWGEFAGVWFEEIEQL